MRYTPPDKKPRLYFHKRDEDIGIDLPCGDEPVTITAGEHKVIDTRVIFEFPLFGSLRRAIYKILLGIDVVGIGGLIWPRGRHETLIMAGVVDPGYRGTIKVKVYNPGPRAVRFGIMDPIAQLVPILAINTQPEFTIHLLDYVTDRGNSGGINCSETQT